MGDANVASGFAKATHYTLATIEKSWEVYVLGINYTGDPHPFNYPIYPAWVGGDALGINRLPKLVKELGIDLVVIQTDVWHVPKYMDALLEEEIFVPVVGLIAVDGKNCQGHKLNRLSKAIFWTKFGESEAKLGGYTGPSAVVPLGVDLTIFQPYDQAPIRKATKYLDTGKSHPNEDSFIVLNVNRNQHRKRLDLTVEYFCDWVEWRNPENVYLMVHAAPTGDTEYDVAQLMEYRGMRDKLILMQPNIGKGIPESHLALTYCYADVMLSTTQGEGWGLCVSPDTLIQTPNGATYMRDISSENTVMGQDGNFYAVKQKISRQSKVLSIKASGLPTTTVTPEHPFLILPRRAAPIEYYKRHPEEPKWVRADQIRVGDLLACPRPKWNAPLPGTFDLAEVSDGNSQMNDTQIWHPMGFSPKTKQQSLSSISKQYGVSKRVAEDAVAFVTGDLVPQRMSSALIVALALEPREKAEPMKINRFIPSSQPVLELLGWYLAEGSTCPKQNKINIDLHINEWLIAERLSKTLKDVFDIDAIVEQNGPNKCRLRASSTFLARWLTKMCGKGAHHKRLDSVLWQSAESLGTLIGSYFLGDGHYDDGKWLLTTASTSLAWQIREILAVVGVHSSILRITRKVGDKIQKAWTILVAGDSVERFCDWTGLDRRTDRTRAAAITAIVRDDYIFVPIRKISSEVEESVVMDIEVEGIHSFVGNGLILHNTTMEGMACGIPQIVPDWAALGEWAKGTAITIPCTTYAATIGRVNVIGGIADKVSTMVALNNVYSQPELRQQLKDKGLQLVNRPEYRWQNIGTKVCEALEGVIDVFQNERLGTNASEVETNCEVHA